MVFKRNQIVVLSLVLMIVVAGYLQYSYKQSSISASNKDTSKIGEAVWVDNSQPVDKQTSAGVAANTKSTSNAKASGAVSASKEANNYFTQSKLDREISRGKDTDSLKAITNDTAASKEVKAKAYESMTKLVDISQKEMRIETLIKDRGFNDALALFGDDGSLDIIVKSPELTNAHAAQIYDIASRQANIPITKIHIKNKF